jgi:hypothetical protein
VSRVVYSFVREIPEASITFIKEFQINYVCLVPSCSLRHSSFFPCYVVYAYTSFSIQDHVVPLCNIDVIFRVHFSEFHIFHSMHYYSRITVQATNAHSSISVTVSFHYMLMSWYCDTNVAVCFCWPELP